VFPVRYELNVYIVLRRNSVFKGLIFYLNGANKRYGVLIAGRIVTYLCAWLIRGVWIVRLDLPITPL
jgi:hypothetical protein